MCHMILFLKKIFFLNLDIIFEMLFAILPSLLLLLKQPTTIFNLQFKKNFYNLRCKC